MSTVDELVEELDKSIVDIKATKEPKISYANIKQGKNKMSKDQRNQAIKKHREEIKKLRASIKKHKLMIKQSRLAYKQHKIINKMK